MSPAWNRVRVWAFSVGDGTSPPPRAGLEALVIEPGAQCDILGVAELRGGQRRALQVRGRVDAVRTTSCSAAGGGAGDDADDSPALLMNVLIAGFGPM